MGPYCSYSGVMSFNLRLPPALDVMARARADAVGISLNAFVCVALTAYIESPVSVFIPPPPLVVSDPPKPVKSPQVGRPPKKTSKKLTKAERVRIYNAQYEKKKAAAAQLDLLDKEKVG